RNEPVRHGARSRAVACAFVTRRGRGFGKRRMTTGISRGVEERLAEIEDKRQGPVIPEWKGGGRPHAIALVAVKADRAIELWIDGAYIKSYGFTAMSGGLGPKRRQGDGQIPEGIYGIDVLNPKSSFHLSMRVDYPNAFDR